MAKNVSADQLHLMQQNLKNLLATYKTLLQEGLHADVLIQTQNDVTPAHRCVLASASRVLREQFNTKENLEINVLNLKLDEIVTTKALKAFLCLIYSGRFDVEGMTWEPLLEVLAACHKYELPFSMKQTCVSFLQEMITSESCLRILEYADTYDIELMKRCKRFVGKNFKNVVLSEGFEELANRRPELLVDLVRKKMERSAPKKFLFHLLMLFMAALRK
ncbi:hypothetical protein O6H91_20G053200 [Diphasiastrum complanatum]|uniref:Uncharacterized protein n=1 Tax=Diphasiastrum complanatum TaxID=34168 RepID=A0ACC2AQC2_DIPCM|nr:hypothetical protein O6H91_20G053200 [Diphasiastrum complanatum]